MNAELELCAVQSSWGSGFDMRAKRQLSTVTQDSAEREMSKATGPGVRNVQSIETPCLKDGAAMGGH